MSVSLTIFDSFLEQSAFIGTSLALQSFKDEFGLKTGTAAEKARFNDLSANIVSTYRECFLTPFRAYFFFSDVFHFFFLFLQHQRAAVLLEPFVLILSATTSGVNGVSSLAPWSSASELSSRSSLAARPGWGSCTPDDSLLGGVWVWPVV